MPGRTRGLRRHRGRWRSGARGRRAADRRGGTPPARPAVSPPRARSHRALRGRRARSRARATCRARRPRTGRAPRVLGQAGAPGRRCGQPWTPRSTPSSAPSRGETRHSGCWDPTFSPAFIDCAASWRRRSGPSATWGKRTRRAASIRPAAGRSRYASSPANHRDFFLSPQSSACGAHRAFTLRRRSRLTCERGSGLFITRDARGSPASASASSWLARSGVVRTHQPGCYRPPQLHGPRAR